MTPKEFYENLEEKKPFTELTSTGISDNLQNVFEFAKMYAEAINYTRCCTESKCDHEPRNPNKKYTSCKKCEMHLQMKP